jgi:prepilin peptidase CpaA
MSFAAAPALLACIVFGAGMLHAIVTDLRHRRIRNWLVATLAAGWAPMALAAGIPAAEMAAAAAAAALVFAAGFGCFVAGWLGGGDVKLASVAVLWLGAGQAPDFVLLSSVIGASLTALLVLARLAAGASARSTGAPSTGPDSRQTPEPRSPAARHAVPYGPALAVAALALLHGSPWAAAF